MDGVAIVAVPIQTECNLTLNWRCGGACMPACRSRISTSTAHPNKPKFPTHRLPPSRSATITASSAIRSRSAEERLPPPPPPPCRARDPLRPLRSTTAARRALRAAAALRAVHVRKRDHVVFAAVPPRVLRAARRRNRRCGAARVAEGLEEQAAVEREVEGVRSGGAVGRRCCGHLAAGPCRDGGVHLAHVQPRVRPYLQPEMQVTADAGGDAPEFRANNSVFFRVLILQQHQPGACAALGGVQHRCGGRSWLPS